MPLSTPLPHISPKAQTYHSNVSRWQFQIPIYMNKLGRIVVDFVFHWKLFPSREVLRHAPEQAKQLKAFLSHDETILAMWNAQRSTWKLLQLHVQGRECLRIVVIIRSVVISRFYRSSDNLHRHDFFFGAITRRSSTQWMTEMHDDVTMGFTPGARILFKIQRGESEWKRSHANWLQSGWWRSEPEFSKGRRWSGQKLPPKFTRKCSHKVKSPRPSHESLKRKS